MFLEYKHILNTNMLRNGKVQGSHMIGYAVPEMYYKSFWKVLSILFIYSIFPFWVFVICFSVVMAVDKTMTVTCELYIYLFT